MAGSPGGKLGSAMLGSETAIPTSSESERLGRARLGSAGNPGGKLGSDTDGSEIAIPMSSDSASDGSASDGSAGKPGGKLGSVGSAKEHALTAHPTVHFVLGISKLEAPYRMAFVATGGGMGPSVPRLPPPVFSAQCLP